MFSLRVFNLVELQQVTREWLESCREGVGESHAPSIMVKNRFMERLMNKGLEFWNRVYNRGFSHAQLGDRPKAIEDFTEATYLGPDALG